MSNKNFGFGTQIRKSPYFDATVITGNSQNLQQKLIKEVLEKYNFTYYIPSWNQGQIIVSQ